MEPQWGWDVAFDMLDFDDTRREDTLSRSQQVPSDRHGTTGGIEVGLTADDVRFSFFDATRVRAEWEFEISDGRFYIGIVTEGSGQLLGDFEPVPIEPGQTFCGAAALPHAISSTGPEAVTVVRCMGPAI